MLADTAFANEVLRNTNSSIAANAVGALDFSVDRIKELLGFWCVQVEGFVEEDALDLQTGIVFPAFCIGVDVRVHFSHVPLAESSANISERLNILVGIEVRDLAHVVNIWPPSCWSWAALWVDDDQELRVWVRFDTVATLATE